MRSMIETSVRSVLVVRSAGRTCALNLTDVIEIMRPLPVSPVGGAPEMVLGLSIIRGTPVLVVDFAAFFDAKGGTYKRFVVVRTGERRVALALDEVLGTHQLTDSALGAMPPLLQAVTGPLSSIGTLDSDLLFVLNSGRIVAEGVLSSLADEGL